MSGPICVIPARMGSSRFPGKPMATISGLPMILHVYERCRLYENFDRVIVATCDDVIYNAVDAHGGEAVMTQDTHERCTDRVEEAIKNLSLDDDPDRQVVMVQGDEALMTPEMAGDVVDSFGANDAVVVNLVSRLYNETDHDDPNTVKVVAAPDGRALYYSRAPIPSRYRVTNTQDMPLYQQTGVMGFSAGFLKEFSALPQTPLEIIESIDMMRVIEHGRTIQFVYTERETVSVDTPNDLARAEAILAQDPLTKTYLRS